MRTLTTSLSGYSYRRPQGVERIETDYTPPFLLGVFMYCMSRTLPNLLRGRGVLQVSSSHHTEGWGYILDRLPSPGRHLDVADGDSPTEDPAKSRKSNVPQ